MLRNYFNPSYDTSVFSRSDGSLKEVKVTVGLTTFYGRFLKIKVISTTMLTISTLGTSILVSLFNINYLITNSIILSPLRQVLCRLCQVQTPQSSFTWSRQLCLRGNPSNFGQFRINNLSILLIALLRVDLVILICRHDRLFTSLNINFFPHCNAYLCRSSPVSAETITDIPLMNPLS